ncbi:ABC transporter permease [Brucella sp. RRSP16]|jgi:NitT/TauT family transport system permease protein|uniref:NitT/TauT family transport system permease protein n=2 Tax=Brucella/Ochrobactrum group TaxID=2826938 RepID=A0ABR6ANQ7_9HYPH|nr:MULTISPECIES: ABC transporter permease [Brucella/Ochrobactrum group]BBA72947.1 binding-protein-dependent transport system inner membrane protein [Ochrobactrum sp. PW1]MBA8843760.1 NitT/TauT family transport system permease protein [Ochrobactrum sp. RH1CCR137]MBA8851096.1 NitT/TauT family transport system permease protein [Brucella intermedia]MBA8856701.1 NitT/TauT family transport system permease protein [Ochrobactrum sp. RH1CCR134]MCH6202270.1 ABC transporter permease [Brucella ciceri]
MNPIQTELPVLNVEQDRLARRERTLRIVMPTLAIIIALGIWEGLVRYYQVPHYLIPAPSLVAQTLIKDGPSLMASMWFTVKLTLISLGCAIIGGILLGMIFALSRPIEMAFFPFAVILQVTPVIAIAPLILIYVRDTFSALLICAWIVAFFPILSNTVIGLRSADHNLRDLFRLYRASPWQRLRYLLAPSALPYFMAALKIAGGLSLIGAVVAEFVAGTAGQSTGLASRILESSFRNEIPRMFAALFLVSLLGIVIFLVTSWLSRLVLGRWHESEIRRER